MQSLAFRLLSLFAVTPLLVGCGSGGREEIPTVPVSGTVQMGGKPLADAEVNFMTDQYAGVATTDASGNFSLTAQAGENKVFITKYQSSDPNFDETMVTGADMPGAAPKQLVPKKYSDPDESELTFTVPEQGATDANFELNAR